MAERTERFQCLLELLDNEDNDDILLSLVPNAATITVQDLNDGRTLREGGRDRGRGGETDRRREGRRA